MRRFVRDEEIARIRDGCLGLDIIDRLDIPPVLLVLGYIARDGDSDRIALGFADGVQHIIAAFKDNQSVREQLLDELIARIVGAMQLDVLTELLFVGGSHVVAVDHHGCK
ncbi:hypothetical protein D3C73_1487460 [compost metagenome]